jgi:hypothetical protein
MKEHPKGFSLSNVSPLLGPFDATVIDSSHACMHQTLVSFTPEEGKDVKYAISSPGRMYVNGTDNVLKYTKTYKLMNGFFDKFSWKIWVRELKRPRDRLTVDTDKFKEKEKDKKANKFGREKQNVAAHYYIVMMAPKGYESTPEEVEKSMNLGKPLKAETSSFANFWSKYLDNILKGTDGEKDDMDEKNWFLLTDVGLTGYCPQEVETKDAVAMSGTVKQLILPYGGTVEVEGEELALFHKTNVIMDGNLTGFMDQLKLKVGAKVEVMVVPNALEDEKMNIPGFEGKYIAVGVTAGKKAKDEMEVDKVDVEMPRARLSGDGLHRINICELYEDSDGSGMITSGLGIIQYSPLIRSKKASESMIGEYVKFEGKNIWFCGVSMAGIDLIHLFKAGDSIDVTLSMLETKVEKAQYEVKVGFSGLSPYCDLLLPDLHIVMKKLYERGIDFELAERIMTKKIGICSKSLPANTALGRIILLEKPENNQTCAKGTVLIETGKHKGKKVTLTRAKLSVLGFSLENADLLYCVISHEMVYVDVSGIDDYPEGMYVPQFCRFLSPFESPAVTDVDTLPVDDKAELVEWLHNHSLTYKMFKEVLENKASPRYFIQFPKYRHLQFMQGRVTSLDSIVNPKNGCTTGYVHVDQGYLNLEEPNEAGKGSVNIKGERVSFVRSNFWVFGRKCAKVDLSYLIQPNQRVNLEVELMTDEDRAKIPDLPKSVSYRASCVWVGPTRPRNDKDDPNKNDSSIFDWLSKRGLNIKQFTKLLEGNLPPHKQMELDVNNFFLPPLHDYLADRRGGRMEDDSMPGEKYPDMPVVRHGPVIANMLENCIVAAGPLDPRLMLLVENDEMAQAAFHVSEALKFALTHYRERTNQPFSGMRGGGGPMMGQVHGSWGGGGKRPGMGGMGMGGFDLRNRSNKRGRF